MVTAGGKRAGWGAQKGPSPTLGRWSSAPSWDGGGNALVGREKAYVTLGGHGLDGSPAPGRVQG